MNVENHKIKYFIYARKSSESEDKQIQSIESQISRLKELAKDLNLDIKKVYTEAKSAKKPNNRPIFDEMISRIEQGEAGGILCWQINRLSRNPVDSGKISWLLQQRIIQSIQTVDRQYLPDDNVILFNVETGSANQFILDLSKNVKRGQQDKLQKGWRPCAAPQGYLNSKFKERGENDISVDPDRFDLVRKMWDLMLTGSYSPPQIVRIANNDWGFRTRKSKRIGGRPLSVSGIYRLFTNIFYTGIIEYSGNQWEGNHEPMITLEEYDRVQILLGRKGRPRPKKHQFAFTGCIHCGECGCFYTAETKTKVIKTTGETKSYTYYHCTRRKKDINCTQRKAISEEKLEAQVKQLLDGLTILPEFLDWALEGLNKRNDVEIDDRTKIYESQHKSLTQTQKELDELTKMRYRQLIDDETFVRERNELQAKINQFKSSLRETENRAERWLELTEKTFEFATYARKAFSTGGLELKKEILMALGKTPTIKDGQLYIEPNEWLVPIKNNYPALEQEYLKLELNKNKSVTGLNKAQNEALTSIRAHWQDTVSVIRTIIQQNKDYIYIPDLASDMV